MGKVWYIFPIISILLVSCAGKKENPYCDEDDEAKRILQGVWIQEDGENPSFMAEGDSIFYPDTASMSARFWVSNDSLYIKGSNVNRYKILTLSDQSFIFQNQNKEEIRLVRDSSKRFMREFRQTRPYALNAFRIHDTDTVSNGRDTRFECRIRLEPTSGRVMKSSYNDDGIEVDNLYLDNVARLQVALNGERVYVHDFLKQEFAAYIPEEFMEKSILRELQYSHADDNAVYLDAVVGIPDADACYVIGLEINREGKLTKKLK